MRGKGRRTAASIRRRSALLDSRRPDALEWSGILTAVVVAVTILAVAGSPVKLMVVPLAVLTVALALRPRVPASADPSPVDGTASLHSEVERARRLEYSFALVQLDRTDTPGVPAKLTAAEQTIRSKLRATDVMIGHGHVLYLVLPSSQAHEIGQVWDRLCETHPDETSYWRRRSVAVFPDDAVTGEGLFEVCRRGTGTVDLRRAGKGRGPAVLPSLSDNGAASAVTEAGETVR